MLIDDFIAKNFTPAEIDAGRKLHESGTLSYEIVRHDDDGTEQVIVVNPNCNDEALPEGYYYETPEPCFICRGDLNTCGCED